MNWDDYIFVSEDSGFFIYKHKYDKGTPQYAYRGMRDEVKDDWDTANNLTDIKIKIQEYIYTAFGNGVISGYRMTSQPPPEEIYRNVAIGKFLCRDEAIDLPRYFAAVTPRYTKTKDGKFSRGVRDWPLFGSEHVRIMENTVPRVRKRIDEEIEKLPQELQKFFFDKSVKVNVG
ncbi:MAG: hypothetical protein OXE59_04740 [Bacteroidetes bacterium]|nr:hypothetical protein [Bacteroidota bacterium]MCY4233031.1 hypothetical protein [Bacteroidota bacterium]